MKKLSAVLFAAILSYALVAWAGPTYLGTITFPADNGLDGGTTYADGGGLVASNVYTAVPFSTANCINQRCRLQCPTATYAHAGSTTRVPDAGFAFHVPASPEWSADLTLMSNSSVVSISHGNCKLYRTP